MLRRESAFICSGLASSRTEAKDWGTENEHKESRWRMRPEPLGSGAAPRSQQEGQPISSSAQRTTASALPKASR